MTKLEAAIKEAERFIERAKKAQEHLDSDKWASYRSIHVASAKRSSMDLSRALSDFRK